MPDLDPNEEGISSRERRRRIAAQKAAGVTGQAKAGAAAQAPKKKPFVYTPPSPPPPRDPTPAGGRKRTHKGGARRASFSEQVGRGKYVKAPRLQDKLTNARWLANAAVNNPSTAVAAGSLAGAAGLGAARGHMSEKHKRQADIAIGGALGTAGGIGANHAAFYGMKRAYSHPSRTASYAKPGSKTGMDFQGPHRKRLDKLKSEARTVSGGDTRAMHHHFNANFPKDLPGGTLRRASARMGPKTMLASAATGALFGAGGTALARREKVRKRENMSQQQINRRKKFGAELTRATSTIGIGSLVALGAAHGAPKLARAGRLGGVSEEKAHAFKEKTKNGLIAAGVISSGIGGINGFNNASWQAAESRQRRRTMVQKNHYGGIEFPALASEGSKEAWENEIEDIQVSKAIGYDPERQRMRRNKRYEEGLMIGSGALGAGAVAEGVRAGREAKKIKPISAVGLSDVENHTKKTVKHVADTLRADSGAKVSGPAAPHTFKVLPAAPVKAAAKHGGRAALLAAGAGGAIYGARKIHRSRKEGSWSPYVAKSGQSAFGIQHD